MDKRSDILVTVIDEGLVHVKGLSVAGKSLMRSNCGEEEIESLELSADAFSEFARKRGLKVVKK